MQYHRIVFLRDEEAEKVLKIIDDEGPEAAILYLSDWDFGDGGGEVTDEPSSGDADDVFEDENYRLTWCSRLGYVGLEELYPEPEQEGDDL